MSKKILIFLCVVLAITASVAVFTMWPEGHKNSHEGHAADNGFVIDGIKGEGIVDLQGYDSLVRNLTIHSKPDKDGVFRPYGGANIEYKGHKTSYIFQLDNGNILVKENVRDRKAESEIVKTIPVTDLLFDFRNLKGEVGKEIGPWKVKIFPRKVYYAEPAGKLKNPYKVTFDILIGEKAGSDKGDR